MTLGSCMEVTLEDGAGMGCHNTSLSSLLSGREMYRLILLQTVLSGAESRLQGLGWGLWHEFSSGCKCELR